MKITQTGAASAQSRPDGQEVKFTTFIPIRFKRRGGRKVIVPPADNGGPSNAQRAPQHDAPLLVALSRAFHWQRLLDEGVVGSGSDIAEREGLHPSTVNEALRLTLLTPDVVQQVLAGHQPRTLSLKWLQLHPLSSDWTTQRTLFDAFDS